MGGITSGVGLFSGINSAQLIDQLLSIDARPKIAIQQRVFGLQSQKAAYLDINSSLLALKTAASKFRQSSTFKTSKAESSNAEALTAIAGTTAAAGSYTFSVRRLVTTQQQLSRGFTDADASAVGAGSFTFELGGGTLASETRLADLNGGAGVERGKIVITDAAGASATVDLSTAVTVGDVVDAINAAGVSAKASVDGDRLQITDTNSAGAGALKVVSATGYNTAASLGIAKTASSGFGGVISGDRIRTLSGGTALSTLNDGTGVNIRDGAPDLLITDRDGAVHNITLGLITHVDQGATIIDQRRATTLQDVITYINAQTGGKVTAALDSTRTGLVLTDTTGGSSNLIVASGASGRTAAEDLGIKTTGVASSSLSGKRLISGLNSVLASSLGGGDGITDNALTITDRDGTATVITISDAALAGSVDDIISNINSQLIADTQNSARIRFNRAGNGLAIIDDGAGAGDVSASGAGATALGIAATGSGATLNGANLQTKWIGRATQLSSLNGGKGIGAGTIRITDSAGGTVALKIDSQKTVDDLIQHINAAAGITVTASINERGDGIVIRDTSGAIGTLKIEDVTGAVAKSLNLVGSDDNDGGVTEIDGSYERSVAITSTDTLNSVVNKINAAGVGATATVIRDGAGSSPFRLSLTSSRSGAIGRVTVDTGAFDLGLSALSKGDDAVAFYGTADPARAVLLTGSSNTLDKVIQGVTIDLKQTTSAPVELVVSRDTDEIEKAVIAFVDAYNAVNTKLDKYDSYDSESKKSTPLFGDGTIETVRSSLRTTVQGTPLGVGGSYQRFFQVGIKITDGKLTLDREKFRAALESDPAAVESLFAARDQVPRTSQVPVEGVNGATVRNTSSVDTFNSLGIAERLAELVTRTTSSVDGTLTRRSRNIDTQVEDQGKRITFIDQKLEVKRLRLTKQFAAMEQAIASLQSQSSALQTLSR